jgi:prepilin-type N-terminal cleavage/methylation domain-containing protein
MRQSFHRSFSSFAATPMRWPNAPNAGFTLVEIMIVVAILGLVMAMGAPSFVRALNKEPLRQATTDISEILGHARATAILRGVPAQARFRGDGRLTVELLAIATLPDAGETGPTDPERESAPLMQRQLDPDVAITLLEVNFRSQMDQPVARVRFHPNGTCDDFTIVIEFRGGIRKLSLDPITSLVDVEVLR